MADIIPFKPKIKATIKQFDNNIWNNLFDVHADIKTKIKNTKISSSGMFSETESEVIVRYSNKISEFNSVYINNKHYHISNIENIEEKNRFLKITCTQVELQDCSIERLITSKDELGRPKQELQTVATYPGVLTKKWIKYIQDTPISTREEEFVFVFPSSCDVEQADIVRVNCNGNAYVVTSAFKPVPYRLEVEATLRRDV